MSKTEKKNITEKDLGVSGEAAGYRLFLTDKNTNECREITKVASWSDDDGDLDFMWVDGNFSCDCNRSLFFYRSMGEPEGETLCGSERFLLTVYGSGGSPVYDEMETGHAP